jgi:hypothetical protein
MKFEEYKIHWDHELQRNDDRIHSRKFEMEDLKSIMALRGTEDVDGDDKVKNEVIFAL